MVTRPLRPCTSPGCPNKVPAGRCERHHRHHRNQGLTWTQLYGPEWPRARLDYLEANPVCVLCGRMADTADHYPIGIRRLRAMGVQNPHVPFRLRALCNPCHGQQTSKHQPGGWNAQRR